jgi:hypothetical protein
VLSTGPKNNSKFKTKFLQSIGSGLKRQLTTISKFLLKTSKSWNGGTLSWKSIKKSLSLTESAKKLKSRASKLSKALHQTKICLTLWEFSWHFGKFTRGTCFISNQSLKTLTGNQIPKNKNCTLSHVGNGINW